MGRTPSEDTKNAISKIIKSSMLWEGPNPKIQRLPFHTSSNHPCWGQDPIRRHKDCHFKDHQIIYVGGRTQSEDTKIAISYIIKSSMLGAGPHPKTQRLPFQRSSNHQWWGQDPIRRYKDCHFIHHQIIHVGGRTPSEDTKIAISKIIKSSMMGAEPHPKTMIAISKIIKSSMMGTGRHSKIQ